MRCWTNASRGLSSQHVSQTFLKALHVTGHTSLKSVILGSTGHWLPCKRRDVEIWMTNGHSPTSPSWRQSPPLTHACLAFFNFLQVLIWLIETLFVCSLSGPPCIMPITNKMFCCVKTDLHFPSVLPGILKCSHNKSLSKSLFELLKDDFDDTSQQAVCVSSVKID